MTAEPIIDATRHRQTAPKRGDIQGLRAIGALLVAIYHIWIGRVSGGVDVFFVVSGYLLIGSLGRQAARQGRIDLFAFATRLARRLLPASLFVLFIVALLAPLILPKMRWDGAMHQLAASTLYIENWYLAFAAVDYLARDEVGSPIQHYWAMSAQVQALLILAAGMTAFAFVRRRPSSRDILVFLSAVAALSLAYAMVMTSRNQPFAYFDTFARIWEFALGGIAALLLPFIRLSPAMRTIGGWLSLAAIVSCGILLEVSTLFPGYAALWPTLAAAAILICGHGEPLPFGVARLLGSRPLVWLGNLSYALYLWHWPILVFYLTLWYRPEASLIGGLSVLALSIALAWATTRWVDAPFSARKGDERPWRTIFGAAGAVALIAAGLFVWNIQTNRLMEDEYARHDDAGLYVGSDALGNGAAKAATLPLLPGPMTVKEDNADVYRDGCHQSLAGAEVLTCSYGPDDAPYVLALVGGSHSAHWLPALQSVIERHPDWKIVTHTKSGCVWSAGDAAGDAAYRDSCARWNEALTEKLLRDRPQLVFTTSTRMRDGREYVPEGYARQWRKIEGSGVGIVAMRDTPWFGFDVPECVEINSADSPLCTRPRAEVLADASPTEALASPSSVHFLDLSDSFCTEETCLPVVGNIQVYYDAHHVTQTYMHSLADSLDARLAPLLKKYQKAGV